MWMFLSSLGFFVTLVAGVLAFVFAAIHYPGFMTNLITSADQLINATLDQYVADRYSVIVKFVFGGNNLVLMGFIVATRLVFSLLLALFFPFSAADRRKADILESGSRSPQISPFYRWGRRMY